MHCWHLLACFVFSAIFLAAPVAGQTFVDIGCPLASGNVKKYWFIRRADTITQHKQDCLLASVGQNFYTKLAMIDTQATNDCLAKYIIDEYNPSADEKYGIGCEDAAYEGIWEWKNIAISLNESATVNVMHWAAGKPSMGTTGNCAVMLIGKTNKASSWWEDVACAGTGTFYAICEQVMKPVDDEDAFDLDVFEAAMGEEKLFQENIN